MPTQNCQHNIPYKKNLVGFASDGANVMFGANNSVKKLLENDVPDPFVMKCLCHSLAFAHRTAVRIFQMKWKTWKSNLYLYET